MKHRIRKLACILLAVFLTAGLLPPLITAHAAGETLVSDMETFKRLMRQDGDVSIRLTADLFEQHGHVEHEDGDLPLWAEVLFPWMLAIDHYLPQYYGPTGERVVTADEDVYDGYQMPFWLEVGKGTKRLELAGHSIIVDYPNIFDAQSYMFNVGTDVSLTISDSTGSLGYIHYEGYVFDVEDYNVNHFYYATDMYRSLFAVNGGSLTLNGGTYEAGRAKKQWITNAHPPDQFGLPDQNQSYTGNVTKSVTGSAVVLNSGDLKINGGVLLGRGEYFSVLRLMGGSARIVEANVNARGGANCLTVDTDVDLDIKSGVFCLHKNDVVYDGRSTGAENYPYQIHYGTAGKLGFTKEDLDYEHVQVSFMDPRPPRHWMLPNSIIQGDGFDLWNEIVVPYGYETFMIVKPVTNTASLCFEADPTRFQTTLNTDHIKVHTDYEPVFREAADALGRTLGLMAYYDVYDADSMTLLGHYTGPPDVSLDLISVDPGLKDRLEEGVTYMVFTTVIETYEGAYPYEVRSVGCGMFTATSHSPIAILQHPGSRISGGKGASVVLTAEAENATEAYWEMTEPYSRKLEPTTFINGKATLTVPVTEEGKYRCCFTNPFYWDPYTENYTYLKTNEAEVAYMPAFELRPGESAEHSAVAGYDTDIILWHDGQEDSGGAFYGWDYGQAGLFTWYKDGVKLDSQAKNEDGTRHYAFSAYWGGGIGLKITQVSASDAGMYECRCALEDRPFQSGSVRLNVLASAGWVYDVALTGMDGAYVGDLPPALSTIRTNDIRVKVSDVTWSDLDSGGHLTPGSYYTVTLEAQCGALFDQELMWSMDAGNLDYAIVSADGSSAVIEDPHKFPGRGDYEEEPDSVRLDQTAFTLYQGSYYPALRQLKSHLVCPDTHSTVLGRAHRISKTEVVDRSAVPLGLTIDADSFSGEVTADPGVYKVTLRYTIADAVTGARHNDWDVVLTFTVLPAEGGPDPEIVHSHIFADWTSDGPGTHSSVCSGCGEKTVFPHDWDEGVVTVSPRKDADGTLVYTCATCGQTRSEVLSYEDYKPPFPEVRDVSISGDTVTIELEEFSGDAEDVRIFIAVYDDAGRFLGITTASPDKSGILTAVMDLTNASSVEVMVLDVELGMVPLTSVFTKDL